MHTLFQIIISTNVLMIVTAAFLLLLQKTPLSFRQRLRIAYIILSCCVALALGFVLIAEHILQAQLVFNVPLLLSNGVEHQPPDPKILQHLSSLENAPATKILFSSAKAKEIFLALHIIGAFIVAARYASAILKLANFPRTCCTIKRLKTLHILYAEQCTIPFSFWLPWHSVVCLTQGCLEDKKTFAYVLHHEAQHLKNYDAAWTHIIWLLKTFCWYNPSFSFVGKNLADLQEFA